MPDKQRFVNQDLVLRVSTSVNPAIFDMNAYEPFLDALCQTREYQKEAIRTVLRYFLSGRYGDLRALAEENFNSSDTLRERYLTVGEMFRHLQLPDQLSCSVDLATATGKSYVMYGIARIMLAHGAVDQVLVLCPSRTIEDGLAAKFRQLSGDPTLLDLLPQTAHVRNPHIVSATQSIVHGDICIENFHAVLPHVKSSVRDSLGGRGSRTLVLNDEVHHVYNASSSDREMKKWKQFLVSQDFGFRYIAGFSGTCYLGDDYFSDVVSRYSLRQAIEQGYAKQIEYVAEDSSGRENEKFQKIYANHERNKQLYRRVKPLTILVTQNITGCEDLTQTLIDFLAEREGLSVDDAAKKVLIVTSAPQHAPNVRALVSVDRDTSPVEWITSVSMLTEGWDVQNVFQIVPHEKRAFSSKLLIAQVLGRGLRIPQAYRGERCVVTVFNHDNWSSSIKHLVEEVMETEKRVHSYPVDKSPDYHFALHNIDYDTSTHTQTFPQEKEVEFSKGYVMLKSQVDTVTVETVYEQATSGAQSVRSTSVRYKTFSLDEVAEMMHNKLKTIDDEAGTGYAIRYTLDWLKDFIRRSLREAGETRDVVNEDNRQRLLKALGVIHRPASQVVRYKLTARAIREFSTRDRKTHSVGVASLRRGDTTVFTDDLSIALSNEEDQVVLQEVLDDETLPRSAHIAVSNTYHFKTPVNVALSNYKPEREFTKGLVKAENVAAIDAWMKSADTGFYEIEYSYRRGNHTKRGSFNPDFFIKKGNHILIIETKGDDQLTDPDDENKAKYRAARQHFSTLNTLLRAHGGYEELEYHFHFLTPSDYSAFFQFLRDGRYDYVSELDAVLAESAGDSAAFMPNGGTNDVVGGVTNAPASSTADTPDSMSDSTDANVPVISVEGKE